MRRPMSDAVAEWVMALMVAIAAAGVAADLASPWLLQ